MALGLDQQGPSSYPSPGRGQPMTNFDCRNKMETAVYVHIKICMDKYMFIECDHTWKNCLEPRNKNGSHVGRRRAKTTLASAAGMHPQDKKTKKRAGKRSATACGRLALCTWRCNDYWHACAPDCVYIFPKELFCKCSVYCFYASIAGVRVSNRLSCS